MRQITILSRNSTDVQTDVHIVPVDRDRSTRKLLILPTPCVALVQDKGIKHPQRAPFTVLHLP